jgi:hypothetical protein
MVSYPPNSRSRYAQLNRKTDGQKEQALDRVQTSSQSEQETKPQTAEAPRTSIDATSSKDASEGKQPKRILWVIPNYRANSTNTQFPLSVKGKCWLATQDSFDYFALALAGIRSGISQARTKHARIRRKRLC